MKIKGMKTMAVLAVLVMAFSAVVVVADISSSDATGNEAQIGDTPYATLAKAIEAVKTGETITVLKDVTTSTQLPSPSTAITFTLDLNGKTVERTGGAYLLVIGNGCDLTINGTTDGSKMIGGVATAAANTTLTINGGTYEGTSGEAAIATNGTYSGQNITISDATFNSTDDTFYLPGSGIYSITNSKITGYTGIYMKGGQLTLTNVEINATGAHAEPVENHNGANSTGDGIILDSLMGYPGQMKLTIDDKSKITSINSYGIREYVTVGSTEATVLIDVKTSDISGKLGGIILSDDFVSSEECTFNANDCFDAKIGNVYFAKLADAISNAVAGETVTVLKNITTNTQITIKKAITLKSEGDITITGTGKKNATILVASSGVTLDGIKIAGPNTTSPGWDSGEYGIKIWGTSLTGVVLKDVTVSGANAGILVNGAVKLEGTITVSGNEFGGIEVSKSGTSQNVKGVLTFDNGAEVVCDSTTVPAIWIDKFNTDYNLDVTDGIVGLPADMKHLRLINTEKNQMMFFNDGKLPGCEAKIGDVHYLTLAEAITNATAGETVTVLKDIEIKNNVTLTIPNGGTLEILKDKALTVEGTLTIQKDATITNDGTIENNGLIQDERESISVGKYVNNGLVYGANASSWGVKEVIDVKSETVTSDYTVGVSSQAVKVSADVIVPQDKALKVEVKPEASIGATIEFPGGTTVPANTIIAVAPAKELDNAFEVKFDGVQIPENTVIRITLPASSSNSEVFYVDGNTPQPMHVVERTSTSVTFETTHNSTYLVVSIASEPEEEEIDDSHNNDYYEQQRQQQYREWMEQQQSSGNSGSDDGVKVVAAAAAAACAVVALLALSLMRRN